MESGQALKGRHKKRLHSKAGTALFVAPFDSLCSPCGQPSAVCLRFAPAQGWDRSDAGNPGRRSCLACPGLAYFRAFGPL